MNNRNIAICLVVSSQVASGGVSGIRYVDALRYLEAGGHASVDLRTVSPLVPMSLGWVRGLLPGDEGTAWLAEVAACLAEAPDAGERQRYVRSYLWAAPKLIWTSWTEYRRASHRRELS